MRQRIKAASLDEFQAVVVYEHPARVKDEGTFGGIYTISRIVHDEALNNRTEREYRELPVY